jgi:hypothetical protein
MNQWMLRLEPHTAGNAAGAAMLDDRLLLTLAAANDAFLRLAAELHAGRPGEPALGIGARQLQSLAAVGPHRRNALAGMPFALFDLRLRDDRWWESLAAASIAVNDGAAARHADARVAEFARFALTLAWHLAQVSETTARLTLGAGDGALRLLRCASLGAVDALALRAAGTVGARFAASEPFWRLFIRCAVAPDADAVLGLKLIGLQLMGMEAARARGVDRRARRLAVP